jgi:hypothetical protein
LPARDAVCGAVLARDDQQHREYAHGYGREEPRFPDRQAAQEQEGVEHAENDEEPRPDPVPQGLWHAVI